MQSVIGEKKKLLEVLTYEVSDGKPIYYRGYKDFLESGKYPEEIMGISILQAKVIQVIVRCLMGKLSDRDYEVFFNEIGVYTNRGFRALDIGIFDKKTISTYAPSYSKIPPVAAIEVDTKVELENITFMEYVEEKIRDLFEIGTKKVIWILTKPRIVMVFEKGKEGRILTWEDEVEVLEGVKFKLSDLIQP